MADKLDLGEVLGNAKVHEQSADELFSDEFTLPSDQDAPAPQSQMMDEYADYVAPKTPEIPQEPQEQVQTEDDEDAAALAEIVAAYKTQKVAERFIARHRADYVPCEASWALLQEHMLHQKLPFTELGLETAFAQLNGTTPIPPPAPEPVKQVKPIVTGLSDRPGDAPVPQEESFSSIASKVGKMSIDDARTMMLRAMQSQAAKQRR